MHGHAVDAAAEFGQVNRGKRRGVGRVAQIEDVDYAVVGIDDKQALTAGIEGHNFGRAFVKDTGGLMTNWLQVDGRLRNGRSGQEIAAEG